MIVTVTPNPSLDRSASLPGPIVRGQVLRLEDISLVAAGKGVNIARALHSAGAPTIALVLAPEHDPLLLGLTEDGIPHRAVQVRHPVRTNLTVTEPDGTTTKFNAPGAALGPDELASLEGAVLAAAREADWVVLTGSLPPGIPVDWYTTMVGRLHAIGTRVAVDASDDALRAVAAAPSPESAPDLVKPNSVELGQLSGDDGDELEAEAAAGSFGRVITAARTLVARGIGRVVVTLGGAGALLVTADAAWHAVAGPITVLSTVGAGDSSLAGFLLAATDGADPGECLRTAVSWGTAAAALPGSTIPTPDQAGAVPVTLTRL